MPVNEKLKKCLEEEEFQSLKKRTKELFDKIKLELENLILTANKTKQNSAF